MTPQLLRAARALLDWDQFKLAEAANLSVGTIRRIEGEKGVFRSTTETRIMDAFRLHGVYLMAMDTGIMIMRVVEPNADADQ
jgi:DNA-binding XRE family transcriptional regulator